MRYTPERWVVLNVTHDGKTYQRVLAGWYGGYLDGDSWKLSSGVEKVEEVGDTILFHNASGSIYECFKGAYGGTGLMASVFESLVKENKPLGVDIKLSDEYNNRVDEFRATMRKFDVDELLKEKEDENDEGLH